jgi:hypothetical protein
MPDDNIREHSFPDELKQIGVDFDGVIHKNSKGYYDGTVYDEPVDGARDALKRLAAKYTVVIYTTKAKADRPVVDGRTGSEMVWRWLEKYEMAEFVSELTAEKPRAIAYIDDKGIEFTDWDSTLERLVV